MIIKSQIIRVLTIRIVCIGMHLARMELRMATARFFQRLPRAQLSQKEGMSTEDMAMKAFFLMAPQGHRCLIEG